MLALFATVVPCALAAYSPDPRLRVVRLAELPVGFNWKSSLHGYVAAAKAQSAAPKGERLAQLGWQRGYEASFAGSDQGGDVHVTSDASIFATPAGATKALAFIERDGNDATRFRELPASPLGADSRLYQVLGVANRYLFAWRAGRVLATVVVDGAQSVDAERIAKLQQKHIGVG